MEDINLLLSYIETEVLNGKKQLLGANILVDGNVILNLVGRIKAELPRVTGTAIIEKARHDAVEIIADAEEKRKAILDANTMINEAKAISQETIKSALNTQKAIEEQTKQEIIKVLASVQKEFGEAGKHIDMIMKYMQGSKQ